MHSLINRRIDNHLNCPMPEMKTKRNLAYYNESFSYEVTPEKLLVNRIIRFTDSNCKCTITLTINRKKEDIKQKKALDSNSKIFRLS